MNDEDIERQTQEVMKSIEGLIPREMQGIIIMGLVMLLFIGVVWFFRSWSARNREAYATGRKKRSGSTRKTRKAAIAAGFTVEDVQREMPEFGKGMIYAMNKKKCTRYTWTEESPLGDKWSLLCRPEEQSPGLNVRGWLLQANLSALSDRMKDAITAIVEDRGEPDTFFEIDVADRQISINWIEGGGDEAVDRLLVYVSRISQAR